MNKIILKSQDVNFILSWRDCHKEYVRKNICPIQALKMIFPETKIEVTAIKDNNLTRFHLNKNGKSCGNFTFEYIDGGLQRLHKDSSNLSQEEKQSVLTVYSSVMALMVFGEKVNESIKRDLNKTAKPRTTQKPNKSSNVTYVLHSCAKDGFILPKGSHASPKGIFGVRGHFRHYKDGKVVWINEYLKGTGKSKKRTYKFSKSSEVI